MRLLQKFFGLLRTPCGLAGACFGATVLSLAPGGVGAAGLVVGWLYGVVVGGILRLFRVPSWSYPLLGLVVGPVPLAVFIGEDVSGDARGVVVLGILGGLVIGFTEWVAIRHAASPDSPA